MSGMEKQRLQQCMEHLAYIFNELGLREVSFRNGEASFCDDEVDINPILIDHLCQHIADIRRDELATDEDELPEHYFD